VHWRLSQKGSKKNRILTSFERLKPSLGGFYRLFEVFSAGRLYPLPFFNTLGSVGYTSTPPQAQLQSRAMKFLETGLGLVPMVRQMSSSATITLPATLKG